MFFAVSVDYHLRYKSVYQVLEDICMTGFDTGQVPVADVLDTRGFVSPADQPTAVPQHSLDGTGRRRS
jgi:hypothetical protein